MAPTRAPTTVSVIANDFLRLGTGKQLSVSPVATTSTTSGALEQVPLFGLTWSILWHAQNLIWNRFAFLIKTRAQSQEQKV